MWQLCVIIYVLLLLSNFLIISLFVLSFVSKCYIPYYMVNEDFELVQLSQVNNSSGTIECSKRFRPVHVCFASI